MTESGPADARELQERIARLEGMVQKLAMLADRCPGNHSIHARDISRTLRQETLPGMEDL